MASKDTVLGEVSQTLKNEHGRIPRPGGLRGRKVDGRVGGCPGLVEGGGELCLLGKQLQLGKVLEADGRVGCVTA